jgi:hypothetical protein
MILPEILAHSDYMQHLTIGQTKKLGLDSKESIKTASNSEQITIRENSHSPTAETIWQFLICLQI